MQAAFPILKRRPAVPNRDAGPLTGIQKARINPILGRLSDVIAECLPVSLQLRNAGMLRVPFCQVDYEPEQTLGICNVMVFPRFRVVIGFDARRSFTSLM